VLNPPPILGLETARAIRRSSRPRRRGHGALQGAVGTLQGAVMKAPGMVSVQHLSVHLPQLM